MISEMFSDVAEVIAQQNPAQIIHLKASLEMSVRVNVLVDKKKEGHLSEGENNELERLLAIDLFISLAKAKAQLLLK